MKPFWNKFDIEFTKKGIIVLVNSDADSCFKLSSIAAHKIKPFLNVFNKFCANETELILSLTLNILVSACIVLT